ncbi:MAG: AEC family transporter [Planctomycetaceae bacterium]|nr:AEC family transporter [Planctomycetaceae bacterium]
MNDVIATFLRSVTSVAPLLIAIATGYVIAKKPWAGESGMAFLSKVSMNYAIPPYLFLTMTRTYHSPADLLFLFYNLRYPVVITVVGFAFAMAAAAAFRIQPPKRGVFINAVTLCNTVLMGLPVVASLYGNEVVPIAMIFYSANTIIFWTAGVWFLRRELPAEPGFNWTVAVRQIFSSRPLMAFCLGVVWVLLGLPMPEFLARTCELAGGAMTPLSMLFIGFVIRFADITAPGKLRNLGFVLLYRYLFVPALTALLCRWLVADATMRKVFFLLCNMPAMAQLPIVAKDVGSDYESASMIAAATTACSMAAVPIYMFLIEYGGILG